MFLERPVNDRTPTPCPPPPPPPLVTFFSGLERGGGGGQQSKAASGGAFIPTTRTERLPFLLFSSPARGQWYGNLE